MARLHNPLSPTVAAAVTLTDRSLQSVFVQEVGPTSAPNGLKFEILCRIALQTPAYQIQYL